MTAEAEVAHVRSFNRIVTQRIGALDDRYSGVTALWARIGCCGRSASGAARCDPSEPASASTPAMPAGCCAPSRAADWSRSPPSPADRRVRVARLTRRGRSELARAREAQRRARRLDPRPPRAGRSRRADHGDANGQAAPDGREIEIRRVDPGGADAQRCIAAYVAELDRRSAERLRRRRGAVRRTPRDDPARRPVPGRLPRGDAGRVRRGEAPSRRARRRSSGCGWRTARGLGIARRLLAELEGAAIRERRFGGAASRRTRRSSRRSRCTARLVTSRCAPFNDEPFADHWFEKRLPSDRRS